MKSLRNKTSHLAWLVAATLPCVAAGQTVFLDMNNLPALVCGQPDFKGPAISPAGAPSGKGSNDVVPNLGPLNPIVRGRVWWTYTAPSDGINRAQLGVSVPAAFGAQYNISYVPAGTGYNSSLPTEFRVSVVRGALDPKTMNSASVITGQVLASAVHQVLPTDVRTSGIATTIDAQVEANATWSVVIQEARNVSNPTANNPNWVQTNYVCTLPVYGTL